jgi:uncharacterized protein (TIGR03435 family)
MRRGWRNRRVKTAAFVALPILLHVIAMPRLLAEAPAGQSPATRSSAGQAPQSLQEMETAGVRMAFDVASVRPNMSNAPAYSRFPLGPGDGFVPNGDLFSATSQPLIVYLRFAFKLAQSDLLGLPTWVYNDRFDIEARAPGNPTKDQVRLMMQSLLAERFKLTRHTAKRSRPVFDLILSKVGKTGPQLQPHPDDESCATTPAPPAPGESPPAAQSAPSSRSGLQLPPISCGSIGPVPASAPGRGRLVGRAVTLQRIAGFLTNPFTGVDRPLRDRTGLTGTFDFSVEWSLATDSAQPLGSPPEDTGPTFLQALQEELGLKLRPTTGSVDVLVIDHVEQPSPN